MSHHCFFLPSASLPLLFHSLSSRSGILKCRYWICCFSSVKMRRANFSSWLCSLFESLCDCVQDKSAQWTPLGLRTGASGHVTGRFCPQSAILFSSSSCFLCRCFRVVRGCLCLWQPCVFRAGLMNIRLHPELCNILAVQRRVGFGQNC